MKAIAVALMLALASSFAYAAVSEAEMERCFQKHKGEMSKPSVTNPRDCWRIHGRHAESS